MRRIFTGAVVRTMDPERPLADLVVVEDGMISAVGRRGEIDLDVEDDEVLDLRGMTILPGFIDAHVHFTQLVWDLSLIDLSRSRTIADLRRAVAEGMESSGTGGWIIGRRLPAAVFEELKACEGKVLEDLGGKESVILGSEDMHSSYLNGKGMEILASEGVLDLSRVDPEAVASGEGAILREEPSFAAWRWLAGREKALEEWTFEAGIDLLLSRGVTGIYTFERIADVRAIAGSPACKNNLRTTAGFYEVDLGSVVSDDREWPAEGVGAGGLKLFIDGSLGSGTALLLEPDGGGSGARIPETLAAPAKIAVSNGIGLCLHAIGDAAVRMALDLLEEVASGEGLDPVKKRIEHIQLIHPDDVHRFGELGAVASVQPLHLIADRDMAREAWGEKCRRAYPLRRLIEGGARIVFGSDAPAGPVDPLLAIKLAATRRIGDEKPGEESWYSGEEIPVQSAVESHTVEGARAMGMERSIGTIREGYRADLVALSRDPFRSEDDLMEAEVLATFVGGECVYSA